MATKLKSGRQSSRKKIEQDNIRIKALTDYLGSSTFTEVFVNQLLKIYSPEDVQCSLKKYLELANTEIDLKEAILLDYYVAGFWWAKEHGLSAMQISIFMCFLQKMLHCINEGKTIADNIQEIKNVFMKLCHKDEMSSTDFSVQQCKEITDFMNICFFQHHSLFEYVFLNSRTEEIIGGDIHIDVIASSDPHWIEPLEESIEQSIFEEKNVSLETNNMLTSDEGKSELTQIDNNGSLSIDVSHDQAEEKILSALTQQEIQNAIKETFKEVLCDVQTEIAQKLKDKEITITNSINKFQKMKAK